MSLLISGRTVALIIVMVTSILGIWFLERAKEGKKINIRTLPAFQGIDEAVKRCVETERPIFFTTGQQSLYSDKGPAHIAGFGILSYLARKTASYGAKLVTIHAFPEMIPIAEQTIKEAYMLEGKIEDVTTDMTLYLPGADAAGYIGEFFRQNAGGAVLTGNFWASSAILFGEPGIAIGAIQIGGTVAIASTAMLAAVCDYIFIGEELYVAGVVASEDIFQLGVIRASDLLKVGMIILMIAGFLFSSIGIDVSSLFSM